MEKSFIRIILVAIIMLLTIPSSFAIPTNSMSWAECPISGGSSQTIGTRSCTDTTYFGIKITGLDLGNEPYIQFRPYYQSKKLLYHPYNVSSNISEKTLVPYDRNLSYIIIGRSIKMKASIPSNDSQAYAAFEGSIYF